MPSPMDLTHALALSREKYEEIAVQALEWAQATCPRSEGDIWTVGGRVVHVVAVFAQLLRYEDEEPELIWCADVSELGTGKCFKVTELSMPTADNPQN